jgi:hypothetical protein
MGASFLETTLPGAMTAAELQRWFSEAVDRAAQEHGSSYSGDWNMCSGLAVHRDPVYPNIDAALAALHQRAMKWEAAHAVRYVTSHMKAPVTWRGDRGMLLPGSGLPGETPVAARVWDQPAGQYVGHAADQVPPRQREKVLTLAKTYWDASGVVSVAQEKFRQWGQGAGSNWADAPDWREGQRLWRARKQACTIQAKAFERAMRVLGPLAAKLYQTEPGTEEWCIGGWAAS